MIALLKLMVQEWMCGTAISGVPILGLCKIARLLKASFQRVKDAKAELYIFGIIMFSNVQILSSHTVRDIKEEPMLATAKVGNRIISWNSVSSMQMKALMETIFIFETVVLTFHSSTASQQQRIIASVV